MEPILLGLVASSIASTAGAVGRAVADVGKPLTSPFAALLRLESQSDATTKPETEKIEDLQSRAEALQKDVEQRISKLIADSKVQLGSEVRLRVSEFDGTLEADGVASPQRQILEAALASDPRLADDFRALAAIRKVLSAAENNEQFAADYARDPRQAIADFASRTDDRFEAILRLSDTDATTRLDFEEAEERINR